MSDSKADMNPFDSPADAKKKGVQFIGAQAAKINDALSEGQRTFECLIGTAKPIAANLRERGWGVRILQVRRQPPEPQREHQRPQARRPPPGRRPRRRVVIGGIDSPVVDDLHVPAALAYEIGNEASERAAIWRFHHGPLRELLRDTRTAWIEISRLFACPPYPPMFTRGSP